MVDKQGVSRRGVLKAVSAGSALVAVDIGTATPLSRELEVAVITEPSASHRTGFLKVLASCRNVGMVAVADHSGRSLAQSREILGARFRAGYRDHTKMLATVRPQLTVITLEGHRSPQAIEAAVSSGSHVIVEKPGCARLADFERAAQLAQRKERHVMLAMATRSSAAIHFARELVVSGRLGKLYATTMDWVADQTRLKSPSYHKSWLAKKKLAGGGKLVFHGIHYLDVIQHITGQKIRSINGFCHNVGGQPIEVEDAAVVTFQSTGGMLGTLNTGYYLDRGKQAQIRIWGATGWLHLDLINRSPVEWYSTAAGAPKGVQRYEYKDVGGLYHLFFQQVIDSIVAEQAPPISTEESIQALRVVYAGYAAASSGRTQTI